MGGTGGGGDSGPDPLPNADIGRNQVPVHPLPKRCVELREYREDPWLNLEGRRGLCEWLYRVNLDSLPRIGIALTVE